MTLNPIIEFAADKNLYQDCWLTELPKDYVQPTEADKKWLWKLVAEDNYFQQLKAVEQESLQKHTVTIESTVPMISSTGKVLNVHHRLYTSYLMAKAYVHKEVVPLTSISSIVIYPTYKLRKVYNESGLVICKGINYLLNPINGCYILLDVLKQYFNIAHSTFEWKENIKYDGIKKAINNWVDDIKYIASIIDRKQIHFKDKIEAKIAKLLQEITAFEVDVFATNSKERTAMVAMANKSKAEIISFLSDFNSYLPMLEEPNKVSLHISWQAVLNNRVDNNDVVQHEMAHVIDFYNGGLNGVPSTSMKFDEIWKEEYKKESKKNSFLNPYAFKNKLEFFAVCAETFFKTPDLLKHHIPAIYKSLTLVYGYEPQTNKKLAALPYLKLNLFSKISAFKIN